MGEEHKLPLGMIRHAVACIDQSIADLAEIAEDEGLTPEQKETIQYILEAQGNACASLTIMASQEIGEEEFMRERIDLDALESAEETDLFDQVLQ